ncbi:MAG: PEP-CTERM sorting domain-containing protein [Phycisphaerae bacterium]|nr:PEP-CTERM sorting domain-containing protein [Phycisphaerae bacterium]
MKCALMTTTLAAMLMASSSPLWADCPIAHTHIGVNPTLRPDWSEPANRALDTDPDLTDNNKLWFFSLPPAHAAGTPGWPAWSNADGSAFLLASPETGPGGSAIIHPTDPTRQLYTCRFMWSKANGYDDSLGVQHVDGWHSAHGPGGMWSLESVDEQTVPGWDLYLKREGTSLAEHDFFMELPAGASVLTANGSSHQLPKAWLPDSNAWGLHEHMTFYFWLSADGSDIGDEFSATFSVYDASGMYTASDPFTFHFAVVPEPASLGMVLMGGLLAARRRHG